MKRELIVVTTIALLFVLVGQAVVYWANPYSFDSDVSISGSGIHYELSSNSATDYSVIVFDNGGFEINELYIYYDDAYGTAGISHEGQTQYIKHLKIELERRNFKNVFMVNAEELRELTDDMTSAAGKAVLMSSGVFPQTVYTGQPDDSILEWASAGGTVYWVGYPIGRYYGTDDGKTAVVQDSNKIIFGATNAVNMSNNLKYGYDTATDRDVGRIFSMNYNGIFGGLSTSLPNTKSVSFIGDGYSSTAFHAYGAGMIAVFGGDMGECRPGMVQAIVSGLSCYSDFSTIETRTGPFKGNMSGDIDITFGSNVTAYVFFGGDYTVYGRSFSL